MVGSNPAGLQALQLFILPKLIYIKNPNDWVVV